MGKNFKRVALGEGHFCYSGPNCRQHGQNITPALDKNVTKNIVAASSVNIVLGSIQNVAQLVQDAICTSSFDMKNISDLQENSLMLHIAVNQCKLHKVCHVYKIKTVTATIKALHKPVYELITLLQKDNYLDQKEANLLRASVQPSVEKMQADIVEADTRFLQKYQESIVGSPTHALAIKQLEAGSNNAIAKSIYSPELKEHYLTVKVPSEKVEDALLLEYWQCGRKKRHNSVENANKALPLQVASGEVTAYTCSYCKNFHIGHGGGDLSLKTQLLNAKEHWEAHPEQANLFASWKSLI